MPHILFVTPYYPPEVGAPQTRISETAVRLVRSGHRVTVLTTLPNYPSGVVPAEYRDNKRRREALDGVEVVRVWSVVRPNKGFLNRMLAQLTFGCLAPFLGAFAVGRPDVIIVESPPLFDAIAGRLLAWWMRRPYVFTVADMWPEAAVQMGMLRNKAAIWLAERLEWSSYRAAAAVWTVTEGLRGRLIQRGLASARVFTVSNGVDCRLFRPLPRSEARAALGWDDRFTILFAGTIGLAPGLTTVLDAAEKMRDQSDARFVLLGDGTAKDELRAEAARRDLRNVDFLDPLSHRQLPIAIAAADVCFAGLRPLPLFQATVPVKCYEAMACARPILLSAADGLAQQIIVREAQAGIALPPGDPSALVAGIRHLQSHPDLAEKFGQRGRAFVEARFDRHTLTAQLEGRLMAVLSATSRRNRLRVIGHAARGAAETQRIP